MYLVNIQVLFRKQSGPPLSLKILTVYTLWHIPVVSTTPNEEAEGSLEPGSSSPAWSKLETTSRKEIFFSNTGAKRTKNLDNKYFL